MIYRILRVLMRYALQVFFRKITIEGLENVPREGPLLVAANHPNTLIDVLLVATSLERRIGFVAKSTLFGNPVLGGFLRAMGAVPVYRRVDATQGTDDKAGNKRSLEACEHTVAAGGAILIFPEGISQTAEPRLMPMKTGLARIALGAEQQGAEVQIVPAALIYDDPERFRSRARIRFGTPILARPFAAEPGGDERAAVRALTRAVGEALRAEVIHVEDAEDEPLVKGLDLLYGHRLEAEAGNRLAASALIARAVNSFADSDPARTARVRGLLEDYREALATAGVDDPVVRWEDRQPSPLADVAFYLGAPLALWGIVHHALFYQLPRLSLAVLRLHRVYFSTQKLLVGMLGLAGCYALQTGLLFFLLRPSWPETALPAAMIYLGTLPLSGLIALLWLEGLGARLRQRAWRKARHDLPQERRRALVEQRQALMRELDRARAEFMAAALADDPLEDGDEL